MNPPRPSAAAITADLVAEQDALDAVVADLDEAGWASATPSPGWSVADQIGHLAYFDRTAALAINDTDAFVAHRAELFGAAGAASADPDDADDATLSWARALSPADLLASWREARAELAAAAATLADDDRVEWYGPSMGARSFLTARLMEAWAHGQDVVDTVGGDRAATDRLFHIAQLGVITRGWSYAVRGREQPEAEVAVVLEAPDGDRWHWAEDASDRVEGTALDFCLVVTQRRHLDDTGLRVTGPAAEEWMAIAQAFAGGPTDGPAPRGT